jgi:tetratricopeptide (TPR) repeat protein
MAIEGPLRELGIHDVFQLLDLSRKTGALRVTSALRDNEGIVYFGNGRVSYASIKSNPHPLGKVLIRAGKITDADLDRARALQTSRADGQRLGQVLVEIGAITQRELERHVRFQIEAVVFELMSWREGFFSFEEGALDDVPGEATASVSTESLLMEGARRIDEWSRIEGKVPHLGVVPVLAPAGGDHPSLLDLLPNEWEVLTMIDGERDLRHIAQELMRSDFDVAKIVYGLVSTGVVELRNIERGATVAMAAAEGSAAQLRRAQIALEGGKPEEALSCARRVIAGDPRNVAARLAAARALTLLGRYADAADELKRAVQADPFDPSVHLALGFAAARSGDLSAAVQSWTQFLSVRPAGAEAETVRTALDAATRLRGVLEEARHG